MVGVTTFKPEYVELGRAMAEKGATDREIAEELGVSERTLNRWKHTQDGFAEQLKLGKDVADERVEQSLYRRATGYTFDAQKVFQYQGEPVVVDFVEHVPPDTTAAIFWLKNRRKEDWRDRHVHEHHQAVDMAAIMDSAHRQTTQAEEADIALWREQGNEGFPPADWGPNRAALKTARIEARGGLSDEEFFALIWSSREQQELVG